MTKNTASGVISQCFTFFVTYEENKVLLKQSQVLYLQHFIFLLNYEWTPTSYSSILNCLERVARDKHSSLLGPFVS